MDPTLANPKAWQQYTEELSVHGKTSVYHTRICKPLTLVLPGPIVFHPVRIHCFPVHPPIHAVDRSDLPWPEQLKGWLEASFQRV